jgi:hypothetical protein
MTLLIAFILIHVFELPWYLYGLALWIWTVKQILYYHMWYKKYDE